MFFSKERIDMIEKEEIAKPDIKTSGTPGPMVQGMINKPKFVPYDESPGFELHPGKEILFRKF